MSSGPERDRRRDFSGRKKRRRSSSSRSKAPWQKSSERDSSRSRRERVVPTSSFSSPPPSSVSISLPRKKEEPPVWLGYAVGFLGVVLLILLGGGHNMSALALALFLPGVSLLVHTPKFSPGVWIDRMALGSLAVFLFAFLPAFYWPEQDWRTEASEFFGVELGALLSFQPMVSLEAWLSALAGFAWFYAAVSWPINHTGRKWFYLLVSFTVGVLAATVFWGNLVSARYPAAPEATVFSFFPNRNQTANFLAVGGVVCLAYGISNLRVRAFAPLAGLLAGGLCMLALIWGVSRAGVLLFFVGMAVWYFLNLRTASFGRPLKLGLPLLLILFGVLLGSNARTMDRLVDFVTTPVGLSENFRGLVYADTLDMIVDAPLTGVGLGNFSAVFPQYRERSATYQRAVHPESDLMWLTSETGIVGLLLILAFLGAYARRCFGLGRGRSGSYRLAALAGVIVFLIHCLIDVPGHRPGTAYFAIIFAALALPRGTTETQTLKPIYWRAVGSLLVLFSVLWAFAGMTGLPLHSSKAVERLENRVDESVLIGDYHNGLVAIDKWLSWKPLDWRGHFQRGNLTLADSGARSEAADDFRRARFLEPIIGDVTYREGFAWLPYDLGRTLSAWRITMAREMEQMDRAFQKMIDEARGRPKLMRGLSQLSEVSTEFRFQFLILQTADRFMPELEKELRDDPALGRFDRSQRTALVGRWVRVGDRDRAESYLETHSHLVHHPWWLRALILQRRADFESALQLVRASIKPPNIPNVALETNSLERLAREFTVLPTDVMRGTALMQAYIKQENYEYVLEVAEAMLEAANHVPAFVTYWKAESLYHLGDYIESWYAFESYTEMVLGK